MKKVYFITTASKLLIKCLEGMGVVYEVHQSPLWSDDHAVSPPSPDIQIAFAYDLITNHDSLASLYDQEEYDEYVREESC